MKTMKFRTSIGAAVLAGALALTLAFAACDNSYGVFHEIQTEKTQAGTDVFKNVTVKTIAEDAVNYYAAMAKVFYRPVVGGTWIVLPVSNDSDYYCAGLASDGASIYVATTDTGGTATLKGLYKGTVGGTVWSASIDTTAIGTKTVDALFWAGSNLFALAHVESTGKYTLYYSDGSTAFVSTGLSDLSVPVLGVVYDGLTYWVITSTTVYTGAAGALAADTAASTPSGNKTLAGIAVDSSNRVLVTTRDGYLYTYSAGWGSSVAINTDVELGALVEAPASPTEKRLILAKHNTGYGYYEFIASSATRYDGNDATNAAYVPLASSYTTTVYTKPVCMIYYSSTTKKLLIALAAQGTDSYALYSNAYDPASSSAKYWSGWTAE